MATEIERKFLLLPALEHKWRELVVRSVPLTQFYISVDPLRTIRVRQDGNSFILCFKGQTVGIARSETEIEISKEDADQLQEMRAHGTCVITKIRHYVPFGGVMFEIDEFQGENKGLIVAEVELDSAEQLFYIPNWFGSEVTRDFKYANSQLAMNPFKDWVK